MPRVKRGTLHTKKRKKILRRTKGFFHRRKSHVREAKQALTKAGQYAYRDRRKKKGTFRRLWNTQISAALKADGQSYSVFLHELKRRNIAINRKMLAELARTRPAIFRSILSETDVQRREAREGNAGRPPLERDGASRGDPTRRAG